VTGRRRAVTVVVGAFAVVALAVLVLRPAGDEATAPPGAAPAFETADLDGRTVRLADHRGEPVLINFWASWCVPCRKEFPLLKAVHGNGATVLGVVFEDTTDAARDFMREQEATWPGLEDPGGRIAESYDVGFRPGLPVTVAVDREGVLVDRHVGELRQEDVDRLVRLASDG
jgi:cytochrome c biogenesis protein CcmG/thiol:disulfide interchange protein DsbE